uniref:Membrane frizzled-related protein n=1 Tax=Nothobranchius pienaari TaxID=704102 RepID=A0A1A8Q725_9TELE
MRLWGPGRGLGVVVISAVALLLVAALGLALALILTQIRGQTLEDQSLTTAAPDLQSAEHKASQMSPTVPLVRVNSNSSTVWVTFRSDASITGNGFAAQYRAVLPRHKSCTREEFMCDGGRCLLPVSMCDGHPNCNDQQDEANCSRKHKECGGQTFGPYGSLASPNHPKPYPHQQLCTWHISVDKGHVITLSFRNFSLETQDVCEFDYVEVHDSSNAEAGRLLGRFAEPPSHQT